MELVTNKLMIPTEYVYPLLGLEWLEWYADHKVFHPGLDLGTPGNTDIGNKVISPAHGFVEFISSKPTILNRQNGGFGWFVIVLHDNNTYTRYAHLNDVTCKLGEIKKLEQVGHLGNSGTTYGHLHFSVFGKKVAEIQTKHWRKWCWYPSGKPKAWVAEHYINPWAWLAEQEDAPQEGIVAWNIKHNLLTKWSKPPTEEELRDGWLNYKLGEAIVTGTLTKKDFNL